MLFSDDIRAAAEIFKLTNTPHIAEKKQCAYTQLGGNFHHSLSLLMAGQALFLINIIPRRESEREHIR